MAEIDELVNRSKAGDQESADQLLSLLKPYLSFIAKSYCGNQNDADIVLQRTEEYIRKNINALNDPADLKGWASSIAEAAAVSMQRDSIQNHSAGVSGSTEYSDADEKFDKNEKPLIPEAERQKIILKVMDQLSEEERTVVMMKMHASMAIPEIAESLHLSTNEVNGILNSAKKKISAEMEKQNSKDGTGAGVGGLSLFASLMYQEAMADGISAGSMAAAVREIEQGGYEAAKFAFTENTGIHEKTLEDTITAALQETDIASPAVPPEPASTVINESTAAAAGGHSAMNAVAAVILAAGVGIGGYAVYKDTSVNKSYSLLSNAFVSFEGYNGQGTMNVTLPSSDDASLNQELSSVTCSTDAENGSLYNGDKITYTCTYGGSDQNAYNLVDTEKTYTVSGLDELTEIDLFENVTCAWQKDGDDFSIAIEDNGTDPEGLTVNYDVQSFDRLGNVTLHADVDKDPEEAGYIIDSYTRNYSIGEAEDDIAAARDACFAIGGILQEDGTCDKTEQEQTEEQQAPAQAANTEIYQIAQSYVGMTGSCDYISYLLTHQYAGTGGVIGYNVTEISYDQLQPGDIIGYYDSPDQAYDSHASTYLGNGMVLSGNFDGSAQIVSINTTSHPYKRYFRVTGPENFVWLTPWVIMPAG